MINRRKKRRFFLVLMSLFSLYLIGTGILIETYSSYYSGANNNGENIKIAPWFFKVNGVSTTNLEINLIDTLDTNSKYSNSSIIPGSTGVISFNIDCTNTEVAVDYAITIDSYVLPPNLKLYVDENYTEEFKSFSGFIGLNDLKTSNLKIYWKWLYTEEDETVDWSTKNLMISFNIDAKQRIDGDA